MNAAGIFVQGYVNKFIFSVKGETWLINVKHSEKKNIDRNIGNWTIRRRIVS